jgi:hypothetical protein
MRPIALLPLAFALLGCTDVCKAPDQLASGALEGSADGAPWAANDATWSLAGSSVQIGHTMADGLMFSIVINAASDSQPVVDLIDREELPFEVVLREGEDGGWATVYRDGETSSFHTGNAGGGVMSFAAKEGDELLGCISFEAATNDGDSMSFDDGLFRLELRAD